MFDVALRGRVLTPAAGAENDGDDVESDGAGAVVELLLLCLLLFEAFENVRV